MLDSVGYVVRPNGTLSYVTGCISLPDCIIFTVDSSEAVCYVFKFKEQKFYRCPDVEDLVFTLRAVKKGSAESEFMADFEESDEFDMVSISYQFYRRVK